MAPSVSVGIGLSDLGETAGDIGGNCVDILIVPRRPDEGDGPVPVGDLFSSRVHIRQVRAPDRPRMVPDPLIRHAP
jgi:hypothetical protein